ncbi:UDP-galactose 4-epimerase [Balneicella halophila]|uniref:UDP-glucose 4-epimerase n=1 Tax=Balneicella halophila TaxID=1537566 RepID=A0A7L4UPJ5_BALHA|nr:UDP-glucose 4-epimerase GalE [Balneicella halophila]PVX50807.1 UDP-galactose 4-epimerase [Balneicella halophila]
MKTVLVTGGMGYIGSHTSVELINSNYKIIIVDNLSNSNKEVLKGIREITGKEPAFIKADCTNENEMNKVFSEHKIDAIIHFAASKAVGESVEKPLLYYKNNINSLVVILEMMRKHHVENIVFSSSCTVYGQPDNLPVTENTPRKEAESPYGNTKSICEDILNDSCKAYDAINTIALRYFNPIGAHPSALIGELPIGVPANLVPYITQTAIGIRKELSVFGNDYNTPDGSCIRDFIHVVDLAKSHVVAVRRLLNNKNKKSFKIFNIGTGKGASVLELINTFEEVNHLKLSYKIVGRREGDIEQIYADVTLANEELGWKAESSLAETLQSAWKWEQNYRSKNKN